MLGCVLKIGSATTEIKDIDAYEEASLIRKVFY